MINNKKVFLVFIICFFTFATLALFPNYGDKVRLNIYFLKSNLEKPFKYLNFKISNYLDILNANKNYSKIINNLENENTYLKQVNSYLRLITSKYADQYKIFHENSLLLPQSIGVSIIGDRNLTYNKSFIINKGSNSGVKVGDYVIDVLNVVGRVKSTSANTSEIITVKSINYGDEVFINSRSYIVSGTNNEYLSFLRQKESMDIPNFRFGDIAVIQKDNVNLILGRVDFIEDQPVLITNNEININNLRVYSDD